MAYFDYNASAPVSSEVKEAVISALHDFGNPSSIYSQGRVARKIIEEAREEVATLVGGQPENVIFTSGATEANNHALRGCGRPDILASAIEHPSVLEIVLDKPKIPVTSEGIVNLNALSKLLEIRGGATVVSVMAANNESGVIQPVKEVADRAHGANALLHCDAVQAVGRMPFNMRRLSVDLATITAHKLGGPKGVGALIFTERTDIMPLIRGGGQERRRRGGTENVPGIAGLGAAARQARRKSSMLYKIEQLRNYLERKVAESIPDAVIFSKEVPRIVNTSLIALPGVKAGTQIIMLDLAGISVSAGAACSSGKIGESHVLRAMGVEEVLGECTIRVSLGLENTLQEVQNFVEVWSHLRKKAA